MSVIDGRISPRTAREEARFLMFPPGGCFYGSPFHDLGANLVEHEVGNYYHSVVIRYDDAQSQFCNAPLT
jgi:hypothetical protein